MTAAAGITTSAQPPTAVVNIQPGMNIQPVVLVDQNGQYVTPGGSSTTAGSLATTTVPVNVAAATAPSSGQVLTATSGTTATWQNRVYGGIFGTGADGAVTFDGVATPVAGATLSGSTYTMTRDIHCTAITVNNGVTVKPANFRIFCRGTVTNNGTISNAGSNASAGTGGANTGTSASFTSGRTGGNGGTGVSGTGANGTAAIFGAAGGNGGAGTSGAAGTGGTTSVTASVASANLLQVPTGILSGVVAYGSGALAVGWGAGGGGGGSDSSSNAGGGGGGGGGVVAIFAWAVTNAGTISANGGNGANGTGGNAGGGGGGSGGLIIIYTLSAWTAGTATVAAGTHGTKSGTGSDGSDGGAGLVLNVVIG